MKLSLCLHTERADVETSYETAYQHFVALCKQGDHGGFHTIWTGEHHAMDFAISPNPLLTIAALSDQIQHARLGTATIVAPFWHPIRLAGEVALTDQITQGRLEVGLSKGAFQYEYDRLAQGIRSEQASEMLCEHVTTLRGLWNGNYTHQGKNWSFPSTSIIPQTSKGTSVPIWIAAQSPETVKFAIEQKCNVQMTPLWHGMKKVKDSVAIFNDAKKESPRNTKLMLLQHAYIVESEQEKATILRHFIRYYSEFFAWFNQSNSVCKGRLEGELNVPVGCSLEELEDNLLVGTVDEILEVLKQYQDLGIDEFALWLANGLSYEQNSHCLKLFTDHVLPHFEN